MSLLLFIEHLWTTSSEVTICLLSSAVDGLSVVFITPINLCFFLENLDTLCDGRDVQFWIQYIIFLPLKKVKNVYYQLVFWYSRKCVIWLKFSKSLFSLFLFRWFRYWRLGTSIEDITKYKLLTNHFLPYHSYEFPSRFQHGCMRALTYHWLASCSFLIYSKRHDSVFCLPCTLFRNFSKK